MRILAWLFATLLMIPLSWSQTAEPVSFISPLPTGTYQVSNRCYGPQGYSLFGQSVHHGIDLNRTRYGTRVQSMAQGVVIFAGYKRSFGNMVIVQHPNGLISSYSHLSTIHVRIGQGLYRGEQVGQVGSTGWSTGPHLYLELRRGHALDYQSYLQQSLIDPMDPRYPVAHTLVSQSADRSDHCLTGIYAHRDTPTYRATRVGATSGGAR